jgi:hypothetical protein
MRILAVVGFGAIAVLTAGVAYGESMQSRQTLRDQLIGSWALVSNTDKNSDGVPKWGTDPKGSLIFEANGRYSFMIVRSDLPRFAAKAADKGTPEENTSVVRGSFANFGTFTIDEQNKTFTTKIEGSIYPNIVGASLTRRVTAIGPNEFRYTNATTATGASADVLWRRIDPAQR